MRIVAGQWRSRRLIRPSSADTRPMPDRVREAVFDMLGAYYDTPGLLPALAVADVFAGGGSMGLEALSRGAASCCFYERDRKALKALKDNLDVLGVGPEASIVARNAWTEAPAGPDGRPFDLVLLDPPYADSVDASETGAVRGYLARLKHGELEETLVILHHHASVCYSPGATDSWRVFKRRTFGSNGITIFQL